jgi:hypothetical protein
MEPRSPESRARAIIAEHYTVQEAVRQRTTKRQRKERAERQAEHNRKGKVAGDKLSGKG